MPTPAFGKLSKLWSSDPAAAELIEAYRPAVTRWARNLERNYPHEDFEPAAMEGLYLAAYSWNPALGTFYARLAWMCRSRCAGLVRRHQRWARRHRLPAEAIDERMYYRSG